MKKLLRISALFYMMCHILYSPQLIAQQCLVWHQNYNTNEKFPTSSAAISSLCSALQQGLQQQQQFGCVFSEFTCNFTHRTYYYDWIDRPIDHVLVTVNKTCDGVDYGKMESTHAVVGIPCQYVGALPQESPPMQCSAGNPIDTSNGAKIQREIDIDSRGVGQLEYARTYKHINNKSVDKWIGTYQQSLSLMPDQTIGDIREQSRSFTSKVHACSSGWVEIQFKISDAWAQDAAAYWDEEKETCDVVKNNKVVKHLAVLAEHVPARKIVAGYIHLVREDGSWLDFYKNTSGTYTSRQGNRGVLKKLGTSTITWEFTTSNNDVEIYNSDGKLMSITSSNGIKQELFYDSTSGLLSRVKDSTGRELLFAYTGNQIASVTVDGNKTTSYTYNSRGLITKVTRPNNATRLYHYEDSRFPVALTGITDERGKRYATWAYDDKGRAISSEHAGGAEKTTLAFNTDGSTTVTNALNKQTIYRFDDIAGARRVTSVEGQPTTNCIGANQNYTYTSEGWLESKTDWNGNKTFYKYNTKGQEISRTEAYGTALAKTITTEWHATLNVKTKVTEPDKETSYTYDTNGLLSSQNTRSLLN